MLTDFERKLVDLVERGEPLVGPGTVSAQVIRDLVLGRLTDKPDPHGIWLQDIHIAGRLDLANVTSTMPIWFENCDLPDGVEASYADLGPIRMTGCRIAHSRLPAFGGRQLRASTLLLTGTTLSGGGDGALFLQESTIDGLLHLERITVSNAAGPAFNGTGMHVASTLLMRNAVVTGQGAMGAVCLYTATIDGGAGLDGSRLRNDSGPAFAADLLQVKGPLDLRNGFTATGHSSSAAVRMIDARLGEVDCSAATMQNREGPALSLNACRTTGSVFLRKDFNASGANCGVSLYASRIDGQLDCTSGTFTATTGPGLQVDHAQIADSVYCGNGFRATGDGDAGAVGLYNARIGSDLSFTRATISNPSGAAIFATGMTLSGALLLRGLTADGAGDRGAIDLLSAQIGGAVECRSSAITNRSGPAIHAATMQLGGRLTFADQVTIVGHDLFGAVIIADARIDGVVLLSQTRMRNDRGPALQLRQTRIRQSLEFRGLRAEGRTTTLDLSQVELGGGLAITPECLEDWWITSVTINVDGFTYVGLPQGITSTEWLELLRTAMPKYAAQPYQQLAAAERAAGHDSRVRRVLMAQRRDQIDKGALTGRAERLWARFSGVALGYGYQPWRALVALFLILLAAGLAAGFFGGWGGLSKVGGGSCALVDRIGFGLDAGTPLITPKAKCETTTTFWGTVLTISGWVFKVLAWGFATLFIAGFTGAVRKT